MMTGVGEVDDYWGVVGLGHDVPTMYRAATSDYLGDLLLPRSLRCGPRWTRTFGRDESAEYSLLLLGDDAVGPFDEADKDGGVAEFSVPVREIGFRDATRPAASSSSKDSDVFGAKFFHGFAEWRPADRDNGIGGSFAHKGSSFTEKKNLNFMTRIRERAAVQEGESGFGGIIGAPRTFDHDFERFSGLLGGCTKREKRKSQQLSEKLPTCHEIVSLPGRAGRNWWAR
jgi:hypothetical protein